MLTEVQPGGCSSSADLILAPQAAGHAAELCSFWPKRVLWLKTCVVSRALLGTFIEGNHPLRAI